MKRIIYCLTLILFVISCNTKKIVSAQDIVDKSIEVSGGEKYLNAEISFDFRDKRYRSIREGGKFQYERQFQDSIGIIKDVLNNAGFERYINNELANIPDSMSVKYTSSVNSVHYFALLPFGLNDAAVNKSNLGEITIKDKV